MDSRFSLLALFSLVMIMITVHARPNPEEYIQDSHVQGGSLVSPHPTKKSHCNTLVDAKDQRKSSSEDYEPRSNGAELKGENSFHKKFEPRPSVTAYVGEFEPRPSVTAYVGEFEPRPSATAYVG